jgi:hypothetical protein
MIDPELNSHLVAIQADLDRLAKKERHWTQFVGGGFYGLGYITGALVLVLIIGWVLNVIGVIPAFSSYANDIKNALDSIHTSSLH